MASSTATTAERRARFEELVRRAEREQAEDPKAYQRRVLWLALLGYLVIGSLILATVALLGWSVWLAIVSPVFLLLLIKKKLIIILGAVLYALIRSLWIRIEPPEGRELDRSEFPALYAEIDSLQQALDTPTIHRVVLSEELNAGMSQVPRFGPVGPTLNTLILGLPLLMALTPEQARAVLAHEFGHLSGNHSRFGAWIYRLRASWLRVMAAMDENQSWATAWLRRFFDWYAPHFQAYSFALARANEYDADASAARLTSPEQAATALVRVSVGADIAHGEYWDRVRRRIEAEAEAPGDTYQGLHGYMKAPATDDKHLTGSLVRALEARTGHADTHPALADRLAALGVDAKLPPAVESSAADAWIGDALPGLLATMNEEWRRRNAGAWTEAHEELLGKRARLDALAARPQAELADLELWELAGLVEELQPDTDPLPLFRAYEERAPDDPDIHFVLGRLLLARDDRRGLDFLRKVLGHRPLVFSACELAIDWLAARDGGYTWWQEQMDAQNDREIAATEERAALTKQDQFIRPELQDGWLEELRAPLAAHGKVKAAWVAAKVLSTYPENPLWVIVVKKAGLFTNGDKLIQWLAKEYEVPYEAFFVLDGGKTKKIAKRVKQVGVKIL